VFPPEVRFIRIESNFFHPVAQTQLAKHVAKIVNAPDLDYYLLATDDSLEQAPAVLAAYRLAVVDGSCARLPTNMVNDLVFCRVQRESPRKAESTEAAAAAAEKPTAAVSARAHGKISADPNPVEICDELGVTKTKLSWTTAGASWVEIRVGSPTGALLNSGGPQGDLETGAWVSQGTTFYLQDASDGAPPGEPSTLAKLTIDAVPGRCP
jgi:hypothetical protein